MKPREIKFRAWDIVELKMHSHKDCFSMSADGKWWQYAEQGYMVNTDDSQEFILMQFTGLKDKNGTEIFEGDVIYCEEYYVKRMGVIVEDIERTGFKINWLTKTDFNEYLHVRIDKIKVIGNIYEHPELINQPNTNK